MLVNCATLVINIIKRMFGEAELEKDTAKRPDVRLEGNWVALQQFWGAVGQQLQGQLIVCLGSAQRVILVEGTFTHVTELEGAHLRL